MKDKRKNRVGSDFVKSSLYRGKNLHQIIYFALCGGLVTYFGSGGGFFTPSFWIGWAFAVTGLLHILIFEKTCRKVFLFIVLASALSVTLAFVGIGNTLARDWLKLLIALAVIVMFLLFMLKRRQRSR